MLRPWHEQERAQGSAAPPRVVDKRREALLRICRQRKKPLDCLRVAADDARSIVRVRAAAVRRNTSRPPLVARLRRGALRARHQDFLLSFGGRPRVTSLAGLRSQTSLARMKDAAAQNKRSGRVVPKINRLFVAARGWCSQHPVRRPCRSRRRTTTCNSCSRIRARRAKS